MAVLVPVPAPGALEVARIALLRRRDVMTVDSRPQVSRRPRLAHPDFMVIGAMRAGTTRLYELLAQHPRVQMSMPKETHHYDAGLYRRFCGPGDQWTSSQAVEDDETYRRLLEPHPPATVSGEASATYLYLPGVLEQVHADLPDIKVVVMLREPAQRAYSSYWYLRGQGREHLPTFEGGLAAEEDRRRRGFGPMWHYVAAGRYAAQLRRCIALLGRERVFVGLTDRLRDDPAGLLHDLSGFLELGPAATAEPTRSNASGAPRSDLVNRLLYPPDGVRRVARALAPGLVTTVQRLRRRNLAAVPPMCARTEQRLRSVFAAEVAATAELTGLDLAAWGY